MGKIKFEDEIREARRLAWEAYAKAQANNEVPAWMVLNGGSAESRITNEVWSVKGYLYKNHILPDGMVWERRSDGSKELVRYDSETGAKNIVISYDLKDEDMLDFFDAEVDLSSRVITMKHAAPVSQLRPEDFMLTYDNFDLTKAWRFDQSSEQNRAEIFGLKPR